MSALDLNRGTDILDPTQALEAAINANTAGDLTNPLSGDLNTGGFKIKSSGQLELQSLGGDMTINTPENIFCFNSGSLRVPIGSTAQRPVAPTNGMIRWNTTTVKLEVWAAGAWVDLT
jgi:hypothetical protein